MFYLRNSLLKSVATLSTVLVLAASSFPFPQQTPTPQASTAAPVRAPRTHDYDVQNYRIVVHFDWGKRSVSGETTITFRPTKDDFKELELDAAQMIITRVRLFEGAPLTYRFEGSEKLLIKLDRPYPAGRDIAVTIDHTGIPSKGLTFIAPTTADPTRPYQIWSQGEAESNHYWFPCYDHPDDKATSELLATIDKKYEVISNGTLIGVTSNATGTRTWHWKMDKPFSSYLISVVAGEFAQVKQSFRNTPIVSYVYPDQVQNATLTFKNLSRMMEFFSKQFGDYPYAKYAQTTVRDFEGGGMENITATTLTDTLVHDRRAHLDVSADGVISHELAHSWFGDMVTCRDWSDLWLNESFATLSESLWSESDRGRDEYLYEMRANQGTYFSAWFRGNRHPIVSRSYNDPDDLFDPYVYQRGAAVLNMLKFVLGDEMFWKAVRHYLAKYQWKNVETSQLISAIQESTGQNLQWFFDEWVYKMGHPEFTIATTYDGAHALQVKVTQTVGTPPGVDASQIPRFFTMPVDIGITTSTGERIHRVLIDKLENDFTFEVDSTPLIVNFDRGNYLIKLMRSQKSNEELAYQVTHDADVMGRVTAAASMLYRSTGPLGVNALSEAVIKDSFWGVRLEAARALSGIKTEGCRQALLEAAKDKDSRVRAAALVGLGRFKDAKLAELFEKVIATDESYYVVAAAANALGETGSPRAFEVLARTVEQNSWENVVRTWTLSGLIGLKDARSLDVGIKYAAPPNPAAVRSVAMQLIGQVGKGSDRALEALVNALKEQSSVAAAAIQPLGNLGDARALPALAEFVLRADTTPQAKQQATIVINRLKEAAKGTQSQERTPRGSAVTAKRVSSIREGARLKEAGIAGS